MSARFVLASGAQLVAGANGLLARVDDRVFRFDLGDRAFERALLDALARAELPGALAGRWTRDTIDAAIDALVAKGVAVPVEASVVIDRTASAETELPSGDVAVVAALDDPWLEELAARPLAARALLVSLGPDGATVLAEEPGAGPCIACAFAFDRRAASALPTRPTDTVHVAARQAELGRAILGELMAAEARPAPGRAWVYHTAGSRRVEPYPRHPRCPRCRAPGAPDDEARVRDVRAARDRRFTPAVLLARSSTEQTARALYRRGREPGSGFGAATARGDNAELRAFAEAIERFCMLHAPADVVGATGSELGERAMEHRLIASLGVRGEEASAAGFRFATHTPALRQDWCHARRTGAEETRLVPHSLVGRAHEGPRLADGSSNGYAAHRDRDEAIASALLELVERDAVLLTWYLTGRPLRIEEARDDVAAFLVTRDVDLPVIWLVARRADGSVRCASAADVSVRGAWARAWDELGCGLAAASPRRPLPDLKDPTASHGPLDHMRYYASEAHSEPIDALFDSPASATLAGLEERWPPMQGARVSSVRHALGEAGLTAWIVDRSLPALFGSEWHVVRALVPGLVELSWGQRYRRLASPRVARALEAGEELSPWPHPIA